MSPNRDQRLLLLKTFLQDNNWLLEKESSKYLNFKGPVNSELSDYELLMPARTSAPDFDIFFDRLVEILASAYSDIPQDFRAVFNDENAIFSLSLNDETANAGQVQLTRFEHLMTAIKATLTSYAAFTLSSFMEGNTKGLAVASYINECKFLHTKAGSFVTRMSLPANLSLASDADLFAPKKNLSAHDINEKLFRALDYISNNVLPHNNVDLSDAGLTASLELFDLPALEKTKQLIDCAETEKLKFSLYGRGYRKKLETPPLSRAALDNLQRFYEAIREKLEEKIPINAYGKILELRSRNPEENKNRVLVEMEVEGARANVAIYLDKTLYPIAIDAHRKNLRVLIKGTAQRMKTQFKMTLVDDFKAGTI